MELKQLIQCLSQDVNLSHLAPTSAKLSGRELVSSVGHQLCIIVVREACACACDDDAVITNQ